jgi:hypothetical protein
VCVLAAGRLFSTHLLWRAWCALIDSWVHCHSILCSLSAYTFYSTAHTHTAMHVACPQCRLPMMQHAPSPHTCLVSCARACLPMPFSATRHTRPPVVVMTLCCSERPCAPQHWGLCCVLPASPLPVQLRPACVQSALSPHHDSARAATPGGRWRVGPGSDNHITLRLSDCSAPCLRGKALVVCSLQGQPAALAQARGRGVFPSARGSTRARTVCTSAARCRVRSTYSK